MQDVGQRPPAASTAAVRSGGCSLLVRPRSLRPSWSCGEACAGGSVSRRRPGSRRGLPSWNTQLAFVGESWDLFGVGGPQRASQSVRGLPAVPRALRVYVGTRGPNLGRACEQGTPPRPGPPWQKGLIGGQPAGRPSLWALEPSSPGPMGWLTVEGLIGALARGLCWSQCAHCAFAGQWPRAVP